MENNFFVQFCFRQIKSNTESDLHPIGKRLIDLHNFIATAISKVSFGKWHVANSLDETTFKQVLEDSFVLEALKKRYESGKFIDLLVKLNEDNSCIGYKIRIYYRLNGSTFLINDRNKDIVIKTLKLQNDPGLTIQS